jgi:hypothetical protein
VIVVLPGFKSEAVLPPIVATEVSEEVKLHAPNDVEAGATRTREGEAVIWTVASGKRPTLGMGPRTVNFIVAVADA